jgi:hypothetical protein
MRPRYRWKYNIKVDLRETGSEHVDWVQMAQDRVQWQTLVIKIMNPEFHKRQEMS